MSLWTRIRNALYPGPLQREIEAELQTHLDELPDRALFGNALRYREESHDIRTLPWLDSLRSDVTFGLRQLARNKTVTAAGILSLALGIGATASAFRLLEAGFLRPLAIRDPQSLHFLRYSLINIDGKPAQRDSFSHPEFLALREALRADAALLMVSFADRQDISFSAPTEVEKVSRQFISPELFDDFALRPAAGRFFNSDDLHTAVISHDYWIRRFGGDAATVGKTFLYDGNSYVIAGVLHPDFTGTSTGAFTDIFLPLRANPAVSQNWTWGRILVHLRPQAAPAAVDQKVRAAFQHFRAEAAKGAPPGTPQKYLDAYRSAQLRLLPAARGISNFHRDYLLPISILTAMAILVLLLSCASVATLFVAQASVRAKEMALRMSIGAGRARLVQLMLVESLMLASAASALGILFSWWSTPVIVTWLNPPDNPVRLRLDMDASVLLMGVGLAFAVTLLFGLVPAWNASSVNPIEAIKGAVPSSHRFSLMRSLVGVQVAFCFLVCFIASLLTTSLRRIDEQPLGFTPDGVLLVECNSARGPAPIPSAVWNSFRARVAELRGVSQAAYSQWLIQAGGVDGVDVEIPGRQADPRGPDALPISAGWLETMNATLIEGRDFTINEPPGTVIVNERFARHYFAGRSAVGEQIVAYNQPLRIVGVTRDIRVSNLRDDVRPTVHIPFRDSISGVLTLRLAPAVELVRAIRELAAKEFPQIRVANIRLQTDLLKVQTIRERLLAALATFFGIVALILSGVGLYAVLSYTVARRQREFAIRLALGAGAGAIVKPVIGETAIALTSGAVAGLGAGIAAERLINAFLFEVSARDPAIIASAALALLVACALAGAGPAWRAIRLDPAQSLRTD